MTDACAILLQQRMTVRNGASATTCSPNVIERQCSIHVSLLSSVLDNSHTFKFKQGEKKYREEVETKERYGHTYNGGDCMQTKPTTSDDDRGK